MRSAEFDISYRHHVSGETVFSARSVDRTTYTAFPVNQWTVSSARTFSEGRFVEVLVIPHDYVLFRYRVLSSWIEHGHTVFPVKQPSTVFRRWASTVDSLIILL